MKIRIPWKVQTTVYLIYQYCCSILSRLTRKKNFGLDISFFCNYQNTTTGATVAIAQIANQLSSQHNVDAYIKPYSGYSKQLSLSVKQHFSPESLNGRLVFVDIGQDNKIVEEMVDDNKQVILTCHAFPMLLHNVPQPKLIRNLELATQIHFVSTHQRLEFIRQYPEIEIESKSFVIANYTRQGTKEATTGNIGIVGHLNREPKNAIRGIQLAHQSNAKLIQCWGSDNIYGLDNPTSYPKLRLNGWTNSIHKMHRSFDVLLSTSRSETFGLVVVEALSAGIPCVLSDIPVYRELYSGCKGIIFITGDDQQDIRSINQLLDQSQSLKKGMIQYWQENFSDQVIRSTWLDKLGRLNTQQ